MASAMVGASVMCEGQSSLEQTSRAVYARGGRCQTTTAMGSFRRPRDGIIRDVSAFLSGPCGFRVAWNGFDWVRFVTTVPMIIRGPETTPSHLRQLRKRRPNRGPADAWADAGSSPFLQMGHLGSFGVTGGEFGIRLSKNHQVAT